MDFFFKFDRKLVERCKNSTQQEYWLLKALLAAFKLIFISLPSTAHPSPFVRITLSRAHSTSVCAQFPLRNQTKKSYPFIVRLFSLVSVFGSCRLFELLFVHFLLPRPPHQNSHLICSIATFYVSPFIYMPVCFVRLRVYVSLFVLCRINKLTGATILCVAVGKGRGENRFDEPHFV